MIVLPHSGGMVQTNCYVVADEAAKAAVLFDAPDDTVGPLLDEIARRGWDLVGLWLTHGHFDHIADHKVVRDRFPNAKVLMHAMDVDKLENPRSGIFQLPFIIPPGRPDGLIVDGQKLSIGSLSCDVIHTPGHSPGHVCFHFVEQEVLIGGDLIICGAVGRTDLPDSVQSDLEESIRRVMQLPLGTKLLPGHCGDSTLSEELASNPYVRAAVEGRTF